jgi:hypothetical protein
MMAVVGLTATAAADSVTAAGKKKPPGVNICALPSASELMAAQIVGPCRKGKTSVQAPRHSPLGGTSGSVLYKGAWGSPTGPSHSLTVIVMHLTGSGKALALAEQIFRGRVLAHGAHVALGKGAFSSTYSETFACPNPPTGDCTNGSFLAIKPGWFVEVFLTGYPPTIPGASEEEAGSEVNDEAEDRKQEEQLEVPLKALGKSVATKV